ncbi:MAG: hypothetical protein ABR978_06815 [Dehalococcoidia bacterium]
MQRSAALQRNTFVDLNVLPPALQPHRYARWYAVGLAAVVAGCLLLVPMVMLQRSASQQTGQLRDQLAVINAQLGQAELEIGEERGLRLQINDAQSALAALKAERVALTGNARPLSQGLSGLFAVAPPALQIKSVARSESKLTVSGEMPSANEVIAYAVALTKTGGFSNVTITSLAEPAGAGAPGTFEIQAAW